MLSASSVRQNIAAAGIEPAISKPYPLWRRAHVKDFIREMRTSKALHLWGHQHCLPKNHLAYLEVAAHLKPIFASSIYRLSRRYSLAKLARFEDAFTQHALPVEIVSDEFECLASFCRGQAPTPVHVIDGILSGLIPTIRLNGEAALYRAVHLRSADVDTALAEPVMPVWSGLPANWAYSSLTEAGSAIGIELAQVKWLIDHCHLDGAWTKKTKRGVFKTYVRIASVDAFRRAYVSIRELNGILGGSTRESLINLKAAGIAPVFFVGNAQCAVFDRHAVERHIKASQ
jgi:hypothetical protein